MPRDNGSRPRPLAQGADSMPRLLPLFEAIAHGNLTKPMQIFLTYRPPLHEDNLKRFSQHGV